MAYSSSVRDDTQQLRDIQDLIARLTISITPADAAEVTVTA
jgi:hypothetical protein